MHVKATVLLAVATMAAFAQEKKATIAGITEYQYPNGLRVLLLPDASSPKITVNMVYLVGSRHEGYGESGMAHLLEHLNFIETTNGRRVKKEIVDRGAVWNGTTSYDRTNYYETFTASDDNLKWALGLEADRMVNVRMDKAILDTEMTVVRNEFERGENSPQRVLTERVLSTMYLWHNYGKSTIGSRVDIEKVPIDRLAAFYHKYYQPDNAVLVIAGQMDVAKTLEYVKQTCGAIPRPARKLDETYTTEPVQDGERSVELRRVGNGKALIVGYHAPSMAHPDSAALEVLSGIMSGGNGTGRLSKALVDNHKALSARMGFDELHDPGYVMASATLSDDQSLDEARKAMLDTIAGVVTEPPTKEEVERVKSRIATGMEQTMANSQQVAMTMTELIASGDWRLYFMNYDQIKHVTPEDVVRVAKLYFKDSNRTVGSFIPTAKPERTEVPAAPELDTLFKDYKTSLVVAEGAAFDPAPANIEKHIVRSRLANGARLALLSKPSGQSAVRAQIELRFGDEHSLAGKTAVSSITSSLLMRGTRTKTKQQIQEEMDRLKARIMVGRSGIGSVSATIQTTSENLAQAIHLAVEILREPAFPEAEFEQVKKQQISGIERGKSEPGVLAGIEFQKYLSPFPKGDVRYVTSIGEEIEELSAVTLDDVKKFHADFFGASNAIAVVVGQFDTAKIQSALAAEIGTWKSNATYAHIGSPYLSSLAADRKIVTPDKENASFLAGSRLRMADTNPDYAGMLLANYMFGGSITSRLSDRVRNREGLSYSVGSRFNAPSDGDGAEFMATAISNPGKAAAVDASFRDELAKTLKDGFTAAELAAAKKSFRDQRVVGRSQDQSLVGLISIRENYDRTLAWDSQLDAKLEAVTLDQASGAFRKYVDAGKLAVVKAGDFK